jgi:hypothetical protein
MENDLPVWDNKHRCREYYIIYYEILQTLIWNLSKHIPYLHPFLGKGLILYLVFINIHSLYIA